MLATMWCLLAVAMSGEILDQLFHHYYCRLVSLEPKHTLQLGFEFNSFTDASGSEMVQTGTRKVVGWKHSLVFYFQNELPCNGLAFERFRVYQRYLQIAMLPWKSFCPWVLCGEEAVSFMQSTLFCYHVLHPWGTSFAMGCVCCAVDPTFKGSDSTVMVTHCSKKKKNGWFISNDRVGCSKHRHPG